MVPKWPFLATFLRPVFSAIRVQHVSDLHLKFARSMADIHSATAEIRRRKKIERKKKKKNKRQDENIMVCPNT